MVSAPDRPTPDLLGALQASIDADRRLRPGAELADAERWARGYASRPEKERRMEVAALLAEYDRRGAVEKAAADYVMAGLCGNPSTSAELTALIAAVRTNGDFRG